MTDRRTNEYRRSKKMSPFQTWLTTFVEEKEVDMSRFLNDHVQTGDVVQGLMNTSPAKQAQAKDIIVKIDFHNGNIYHFFGHLAQALSPEAVENQRQAMLNVMIGAEA